MTLSLISLINGAVLLFIMIDYSIIRFGSKILETKEKLKKYRVLISMLIAFIISLIFLCFFRENITTFIPNLINKFLEPFGASRTGETVAENLRPYLMDWIVQIGKIFFWVFYLGMAFVGIEMSKGIGKQKNKILFSVFWIIMVSGVLFSRISPTSLLDGTNFISIVFYLGSLLLFVGYCVWLYFNDEVKVENGLLIIASWLLFMMIGGRGAIRLLFVVTPFVCFMIGYAFIKIIDYLKRSKEILRIILFFLFILVLMGLISNSITLMGSINYQSKHVGPTANVQWLNSMEWVRDNTLEGSLFLHWWDYGYWVQYLGERPSLTDGGHGNGYWDHLIGRYVLTTPYPGSALSFMKSHNINYLLIDPTDLGKYGAYSKIGSGMDGVDRFSHVPIMQSDVTQIKETSDGITFVYGGGTFLDEDIIYEVEGKEILLPSQRALIIGIVLEVNHTKEINSAKQPLGIFFYNNKQIIIPLRYVYMDGKIKDFNTGLDSILQIIPKITQIGGGIQIDNFGSVIYLSPKVSKSLFAQLYLMDDVFNNYDTLRIVHVESDMVVQDLNNQGADLDELIFFNGFRGPIKIWEVNYPSNIVAREEFVRESGEYAEFDNLVFTREVVQ